MDVENQCQDEKPDMPNRLRSKWLPIREAKDIVKSLNISTTREYQSLYRQGKLSIELPGSPTKLYEGKGWTHWNDYLGKSRYIRTKSRLRFKRQESLQEV